VPGVLEGQELGIGLPPRLILEDDVVVPVRVEGRVEVDQIDALVRDVAAKDVEVVAVVEDVGLDLGSPPTAR
jgi:hypothetical protein